MSGFRVNQASGHIIEAKRQCKGAVDIEEQCRKAEAGSVAKPGWRAGYLGVFDPRPRFQRDPHFFFQAP